MNDVNASPETRALNLAYHTARYDSLGRFVAANYKFLGLLGYGLEELLEMDASRFFSASHFRDAHREIWERMKERETVEATELWVTKGGHEAWLHSKYVPMPTSDGDFEVVQISSDASAAEAQRADERSQIAAIHQTQAVAHFSPDGTVLDANPIMLSLVGYDQDELVGKHHRMLVDAQQASTEAYRGFWEALAAGEYRSGEFRRIRKDGSEVWLQALYSPVFDSAGRPVKVVKYATDITKSRLRQADYEWQIDAINKSNCSITFDLYGTILEANELFLEATGYSIEEIQGRHHRLFVDPSHAHSSEYAAFWSALRRGRHSSGLFKRFGRDGREVWLQATYNPIFDAVGRPIKVVKFASVVTEERLLQAEHQGQIAAIHNSQCVVSFDLDGCIIDTNENFLDLTGYRFAEVRGQHHRIFVGAEEAGSEDYRAFWRDLAAGRHRSGEYKRVGKDGREIWLQATYNPILDLSGRPFKIVKYATDITQEKLRQSDHEGQIRAINKSQGVVTLGLDGTILDANENFLGFLGYALEEVKGKHHSTLLERSDAASADYVSFWKTLRSGEHLSGLFKRIGKDGREVWIQASYNPILDLNGKPSRVIKYASDVSSNIALAQAFDDAKRQAQHDAATSLPNRLKLSAFMDGILASPAAEMVVFYLDLDRFKPINDTHGHHVGDRVLGEVADRLRRVLREDQMAARVGGDEFVIVAPDMPPAAIERFCEKLFATVTAPIRHDGQELSVGMSVGIAVSPADGRKPDELLRAADAALYRSKQNGRGTFSFFATEMNERVARDRKLAQDMRHSLAAGDFYLEYQPRFDTRSRSIRSMEALVRWAHPEQGRISPQDFIPAAEQNGLIMPLGEWILRQACQAAAKWDGIGVSVNLSPVQFRDGTLVSKVRDCLEESGLPAALLELEITEGVLLEDADRANAILTSLKLLGVKLAMDDFGTGYSSLSYLRNFPFDVIKIDRSFVGDLDSRSNARPIVQAILGLGKALGLSVTAEGVETNSQLALLTADQCQEVQGFLMAPPLREDQVHKLLATLWQERDDGFARSMAVSG